MTSATSQIDQLTADAALERARAHLAGRQHADGWWKGALDTNVTMDAEDLLLREFLGIRGDWAIRRPDVPTGGWAFEFANDIYPDIDDTTEIVMALRRVAHPDRARV